MDFFHRALHLVSIYLCLIQSVLSLASDGEAISGSKAISIITANLPHSYAFTPGAVLSPQTDSVVFTAASQTKWKSKECPETSVIVDRISDTENPLNANLCGASGLPGTFQSTRILHGQIGYVLFNGITNPTTKKVSSAEACHALCQRTPGCLFWQYVPTRLNLPQSVHGIRSSGGGCFLEDRKVGFQCGELKVSYNSYDVRTIETTLDVRTGKVCDRDVLVNKSRVRKPHLALFKRRKSSDVPFPNSSLCLYSDSEVHVNMKLRGYKNGESEKKWIRELAILYRSGGENHNVRLVARSGKSQSRDQGFLESIEIDGAKLPTLAVGESLSNSTGLQIQFVGYEKVGQFDVDVYTIDINAIAVMEVRARIAHPLYQSPRDAEAHMNINLKPLRSSENVHGILGRKYRSSNPGSFMRDQDTSVFKEDTDGSSDDVLGENNYYLFAASDLFAPDCPVSAFDLPLDPSESLQDS